jgi:glycosyl transferase family 25
MEQLGGVYVINLDRRTDRLTEITEELNKIGLPFKRFSAIDRKPGILGCGLSHLAVLKEARERGLKNVLIFEDDFTFLVSKEVFWEKIRDLSGTTFDVCMLGYNLQHSQPHTSLLVKVLEAQTASAYIVNQSFYDPLIALYEDAMPLLENTGYHWIYANDQIWKDLQAGANWFAFKERIGRQRPSWSDNAENFMDHGV